MYLPERHAEENNIRDRARMIAKKPDDRQLSEAQGLPNLSEIDAYPEKQCVECLLGEERLDSPPIQVPRGFKNKKAMPLSSRNLPFDCLSALGHGDFYSWNGKVHLTHSTKYELAAWSGPPRFRPRRLCVFER